MRIEIHAVNFDLLRERRNGIEDRIRRWLDRFEPRIEVVRVRFEDVNG